MDNETHTYYDFDTCMEKWGIEEPTGQYYTRLKLADSAGFFPDPVDLVMMLLIVGAILSLYMYTLRSH